MRAPQARVARRHTTLIGKQFGNLTITGIVHDDDARYYLAQVICSCGTLKTVRLSRLEFGGVKSCGCLFTAAVRRKGRNSTHGLKGTPEYAAWANMLHRCNSKTYKAFKNYGGRGITVCKEWEDSFEQFYRDMGRRPSSRYSLDRIDNDKGYMPSNCRWALPITQMNNRRATRRLTAFGETRSLSEWAVIFSVGRTTIRRRLQHGWALESAISTPPGALPSFNAETADQS